MLTKFVCLLVLTFHAYVAGSPARAAPFDKCAVIRTIAQSGSWNATTRVTMSKSKGGLGATGFYEATFMADGCKLSVGMTKTGYGTKEYDRMELMAGQADVVIEGIGEDEMRRPDEFLLSFTITLASESGTELRVVYEIIYTAKKLFGRWSYLGDSWKTAGMAGFLLAERQPKGGKVQFKTAKAISCDRVCELAGFYYDSNSSQMCQDDCTKHGPFFGLVTEGEPPLTSRTAP